LNGHSWHDHTFVVSAVFMFLFQILTTDAFNSCFLNNKLLNLY
jgi:hypothetical protein